MGPPRMSRRIPCNADMDAFEALIQTAPTIFAGLVAWGRISTKSAARMLGCSRKWGADLVVTSSQRSAACRWRHDRAPTRHSAPELPYPCSRLHPAGATMSIPIVTVADANQTDPVSRSRGSFAISEARSTTTSICGPMTVHWNEFIKRSINNVENKPSGKPARPPPSSIARA